MKCGLICRDEDLVRRIGTATALEVRASGAQFAFAPCVAVSSKNSFNS